MYFNICRTWLFVLMLFRCESDFEMLVQQCKGRKYCVMSSIATSKNRTVLVVHIRDTCESLHFGSNKKEPTCKG